MIGGVKKRNPPSGNDSEIQNRLGAVIRMRRRHLGMTQEELAKRARMHRTYIADIEGGARNVTLQTVAHLARALRTTSGNLFAYVSARTGAEMRAGAGPALGEVLEILLVDPNAGDSAMTASALKRARLSAPVRSVADGEAGLAYLFGTGPQAKRIPARPQLILVNPRLPRMSGSDFLRKVKGDERTRDIPVVLLTASR